VTDTNPPYEVGDLPGPTYGLIQTPNSNTYKPGVHDAEYAYTQKEDRNCESYYPAFGWLAFNLTANIICNVRPGLSTMYQRLSY
jgi:hypothetical protein